MKFLNLSFWKEVEGRDGAMLKITMNIIVLVVTRHRKAKYSTIYIYLLYHIDDLLVSYILSKSFFKSISLPHPFSTHHHLFKAYLAFWLANRHMTQRLRPKWLPITSGWQSKPKKIHTQITYQVDLV